ncbi:type II toxin-antitoxin system VapB family antitoxin [Kineosphaera limosa]|uniref:type II toxin-antitoxin system VapB family antitoxin n=1 Tax=Kineosphaera limosa TaxID=111564 RepID=UPI00402B9864
MRPSNASTPRRRRRGGGAEAAALGLSRNELLRRRLEGEALRPVGVTVTASDWSRSAAVFGDLDDPSVMDAAWR